MKRLLDAIAWSPERLGAPLFALALVLTAHPAQARPSVTDAYAEYAQRADVLSPDGEAALWVYFLRLHPTSPHATRVRRRLVVLESVIAQRKRIAEDIEAVAAWRAASSAQDPAAEAAAARELLAAGAGPFEDEVRGRIEWLARAIPTPRPSPPPPPLPAATPPHVASAPHPAGPEATPRSTPPRGAAPAPDRAWAIATPTPAPTWHPNAPLPSATATPRGALDWTVPGLGRTAGPTATPVPAPTALALAPVEPVPDPTGTDRRCASAYAALASAQESLGACLRLGGSCDGALADVAAAREAAERCRPRASTTHGGTVPVEVPVPSAPGSAALALAPTPPTTEPISPADPPEDSACGSFVAQVEDARLQVTACVVVQGSEACAREFEALEQVWAARSTCEEEARETHDVVEPLVDFERWKTAVSALPIHERSDAWRLFLKLVPDSPFVASARQEMKRADLAVLEEERAREDQRRAEAEEKKQEGREKCIGGGAGAAIVLILLLLL